MNITFNDGTKNEKISDTEYFVEANNKRHYFNNENGISFENKETGETVIEYSGLATDNNPIS